MAINIEQTEALEADLALKITQLITAGPRSHEALVASMSALASVLVMLALKTSGKEEAKKIISSLIESATEIVDRCIQEMKDDNETEG